MSLVMLKMAMPLMALVVGFVFVSAPVRVEMEAVPMEAVPLEPHVHEAPAVEDGPVVEEIPVGEEAEVPEVVPTEPELEEE